MAISAIAYFTNTLDNQSSGRDRVRPNYLKVGDLFYKICTSIYAKFRKKISSDTTSGRSQTSPWFFYVIRTLHKKSRQSLRPSTGRIGWDFFSKIGIKWGTYFSKKVPIFETFWFTPAMHRPLTVKGVYVVSHSWYVQVYELVCMSFWPQTSSFSFERDFKDYNCILFFSLYFFWYIKNKFLKELTKHFPKHKLESSNLSLET